MSDDIQVDRTADDLEHRRFEIDLRKYHLELKKFGLERMKFRKDDRSLARRLGTVVAVVVSVITGVIAIATFLVQYHSASLARQAASEQAARQWKLQSAKLMSEANDQLFSADSGKRAMAIQMLKLALPYETYNQIFGAATSEAKDEFSKVQYRNAQYIRPRWPEGQIGLHARALEYAASVPPKQRTEDGRTIIAICRAINTQVAERKLDGDDYLFSVKVNADGDKDPIDWVIFTPHHPEFVVESTGPLKPRTISWTGVKFINGAEFQYIGKYPIDELSIEVYRSKDRAKCVHSVYLARDLRR